jgi:hypothetical protein
VIDYANRRPANPRRPQILIAYVNPGYHEDAPVQARPFVSYYEFVASTKVRGARRLQSNLCPDRNNVLTNLNEVIRAIRSPNALGLMRNPG